MASEGFCGFPTKHVMILVMTGTGWGVDPRLEDIGRSK